MSFRYEFGENLLLTGGINNLTVDGPFLDTLILPVGPIGRTYCLNLRGNL